MKRTAALAVLLVLHATAWAAAAPGDVAGTVVPHPVPWKFASERYAVTVNGKPVNVPFAAMNLHVASFDFVGRADVRVTVNENDYNRLDGKPLPKANDLRQGAAVVRPPSRGVTPKTQSLTSRTIILRDSDVIHFASHERMGRLTRSSRPSAATAGATRDTATTCSKTST